MSKNKDTVIAANWKMNLTMNEAKELAEGIVQESQKFNGKEVILLPPAVYITEIAKIVGPTNIGLGGQDVAFEERGAYTGEIACFQLKDVGCTHVLIGHSERRHYFGEDYETVNKKVLRALSSCLKIILCVGESIKEREKGITEMVVVDQLESAFEDVSSGHCKSIMIAYEPIWAIGTGKTATPEDADHVHTIIHKTMERIFNKDISENIRILYGGSVKPENIRPLVEKETIDGALVGGASLNLDTFSSLLKNS